MSLILPRPSDRYERTTEDQRNRMLERADAQSLKSGIDNTLTPGTRIQTATWDDLRFPSSGLSPPGPVDAPTTDPELGLLRFEDAKINLTAGLAQLPHHWLEGSALEPHAHWIQPAAGNVVWRLEYRLTQAVNGLLPTTWTTVTSTDTVATYPGSGNLIQITRFPAIDMTGYRISAMVLFRLARLGADALDTMVGNATLLEFDLHYQRDSFGSRQEFVK